jgi:hypothetical protein
MDRDPGRAHHVLAGAGRPAERRFAPRPFVLSIGDGQRSAYQRLVERVRKHLPLLRLYPAGLDLKGGWATKSLRWGLDGRSPTARSEPLLWMGRGLHRGVIG